MPIQSSVQPIPFFQLGKLGGSPFLARRPHPTAQAVPVTGTGFTDFYCQSTGNQTNSGSTNTDAPLYASVNGNWNGTNTFIPTDGSSPSDLGVTVGMFASVFVDGAATAALIIRIASVASGPNGAITMLTTSQIGSPPTVSATARSLRVGGAIIGPSGASSFPFTLSGNGYNIRNIAGDRVRWNIRNDTPISVTGGITLNNAGGCTIQGYQNVPGDGGKATITNSSTSVSIGAGVTNVTHKDLIFDSTAGSGTAQSYSSSGSGHIFDRCVFRNARVAGVNLGGLCILNECEIYNNNLNNSANLAGLTGAGTIILNRCYIHDNRGSNTEGIYATAGMCLINCIIESNGSHGVENNAAGGGLVVAIGTDFYNNGGDAVRGNPNGVTQDRVSIFVQNCNFLNNRGRPINLVLAGISGISENCSYGTGSQANWLADTYASLEVTGKVLLPPDVTPWNSPNTGDFSITLPSSKGVGRGAFTELASGKSGTVAYPDVGAAQSLATVGGGADEGIGGVGGG